MFEFFKGSFYLTAARLFLKVTKGFVYKTPFPIDNIVHDYLEQLLEDDGFVEWFTSLHSKKHPLPPNDV